MAQYFEAAEASGKRKAMQPGDTIDLDHGLRIEALVVNAVDVDGDSVDVFFPGRRPDCAENDLSIALLLSFGDFSYLLGGDLTGAPDEKVADVEALIKDDVPDIDVYHINHHGAETSSSTDFVAAMNPTVAIASNGSKHGHPRETVINNQIRADGRTPDVYLTNLNDDSDAWQEDHDFIADLDMDDYDGIIEISVWKRTYRIWRWRDGDRIDSPGRQYQIKR